MTRVKTFTTPQDFAGIDDQRTQQEAAELFSQLFPGQTAPTIDDGHLGLAIAAHNPGLALQLAKMSKFIALELPWCQRTDLRELAIQTVNSHFASGYAFATRAAIAESAGITHDMQAALRSGQTSDLFDEEQQLVIDYSRAVASGRVPEALFRTVVARYGEKGAVEFTTVVGFWGFWAMLLNATGAELPAKVK